MDSSKRNSKKAMASNLRAMASKLSASRLGLVDR